MRPCAPARITDQMSTTTKSIFDHDGLMTAMRIAVFGFVCPYCGGDWGQDACKRWGLLVYRALKEERERCFGGPYEPWMVDPASECARIA
jgi:hypothetical protein